MEEGFILKCTLTDVAHPVVEGVVAGAQGLHGLHHQEESRMAMSNVSFNQAPPPKGSTAFQTASPVGTQVCKYTNL